MNRGRKKTVAFLLAVVLMFTSISANEGSVLNVFAENAEESVEENNEENQEEVEQKEEEEKQEENQEEKQEEKADSEQQNEVLDDEAQEVIEEEGTHEILDEDVPESSTIPEVGTTQDSTELENTEQSTTEVTTEIVTEVETEQTTEETTEEITTEEMTETLVEEIDTILITYEAESGGYVDIDSEEVSLAEDAEGPKGATATADAGYEFVNWTSDGEEISRSEHFVPEAIEATYTAHFQETMPKFKASETVNGVKVTVSAKAGVIPRGATIAVTAVTDSAVVDAVLNEIDTQKKEITNLYAFDIKIMNKEGEEIQPSGNVNVDFQNVTLEGEDIDVYHVEDNRKDVDQLQSSKVESSEEKVSFKTNHFSIYVAVSTNTIGQNNKNPYILYVGETLTLRSDIEECEYNTWELDNSDNKYITISEKTNTSALITALAVKNKNVIEIKHRIGTNFLGWAQYEKFYVKVVAVPTINLVGNDVVYTGYQQSYTTLISQNTSFLADKTVTWSVSDETVATVDETGTVTGLKAGTVTLTGKYTDAFYGEKTLTIQDPVEITSLEIMASAEMTAGDTQIATANVLPQNATFTVLKWESSDDTIASVNEATGYITAKQKGTVTITVSAKEGAPIQESMQITVKPVTYKVTLAESEHGTLTFLENYTSPYDAEANSEIIVVATPEQGYYCTGVTATNRQVVEDLEDGTYTIEALTATTTLTATFASKTMYSGKTVKFFVLLPSRGTPNSAADQGESNYYPSSKNNGGISGLTQNTGYPGGQITIKAWNKIRYGYDLFNVSGYGDEYISEPSNLGDCADYKINWYTIKNQGDGIHVDGYVTGQYVNIYYHNNYGTEDHYYETKGVTGEEYTVLSYTDTGLDTRTNYTFAGWNTKADGTGTSYPSGSKLTVVTGLDLYAQWTQDTYTITATADNGTIDPSGTVVVAAGKDAVFNYSPNTGYELSYIKIDGQTINTLVQHANSYTFANVAADHSIEVGYKASNYTFTWNLIKPDGTTTTVDSTVYSAGATIPTSDIPDASEYSIEGYTLVNEWSKTPAIMPAEDQTLTSYYTPNNYPWTVNLIYDDGKATETFDYAAAPYSTSVSYTVDHKTDYMLEKICVRDIEQQAAYGNVSMNIGVTNNVIDIYYAKDVIGEDDPEEGDNIPDRYQVLFTYVSDNRSQGTVTGTIKEVVTRRDADGNYSETAAVSPKAENIIVILKPGYQFTNWKAGTISYADTSVIANTKFTANTEFRACFVEEKFTVIFDANGGYFGLLPGITTQEQVKEIPYEGTVDDRMPAQPKYAGHQFIQWYYVTEEGNQLAFTQDTIVTSDMTVYASWSARNDINVYSQYVLAGTSTVLAEGMTLTKQMLGETVTIKANEVPAGYQLVDENDKIIGKSVEVVADDDNTKANMVTFYCEKQTDLTVTVEYRLETEEGISVAKDEDIRAPYTMGEAVSILANAELIKDNYRLKAGQDSKNITIAAENKVIFLCEEVAYTVTYVAGDYGKLIQDNFWIFDTEKQTLQQQNITISTQEVKTPDTKADVNYVFSHWEDANGNTITNMPKTGADVANAYVTNPTLTYYARFTPVEYTIHFVAPAKYGTIADITFTADSKEEAFRTLEKKNLYTFQGWYAVPAEQVKDNAQKYLNTTDVKNAIYAELGNTSKQLHDYTLYAKCNMDVNARFFVRQDNVRPDESIITDYEKKFYSQVATGSIDLDGVFNQATGSTTGYDGRYLNNLFGISLDKGNTLEGMYEIDPSSVSYDALNTMLVENGFSAYNPDTQYIRWYVIKYYDTESFWHVDGVITDKAKLHYAVNTQQLMYNGDDQTVETTELVVKDDNDNLYKVSGVKASATGELIGKYGVDTVSHDGEFKVLDMQNKDVTPYYTFPTASDISGDLLEITKRPLVLTAGTANWPYDGKEHVYHELAQDGIDGLVEDHVLDLTFDAESKITFVGNVDNKLSDVKVYEDANKTKDVTDNYLITFLTGKLIVNHDTPIAITVKSASTTKVYDGTALTYNVIETPTGLCAGDEVSASVTGTQTEVFQGTGNNTLTVENVMIKRGTVDVTDCYAITTEAGTLTVLPRPITVTADSATRAYDGLPLSDADYSYTEFDALENPDAGLLTNLNHSVTATVVGSITKTGSVPNEISNIEIKDATGNDISANYSITPVDGKLTIIDGTKELITVSGRQLTKPYDGTAFSAAQTDYDVTGSLFQTDEAVVTIGTEAVTDVAEGTKDYTVTFSIRNKETLEDVTSQYETIANNGSLQITPREVTITAGSHDWEYDGEIHSLAEFTSTGLLNGDRITEGTIYTSGSIKKPGKVDNVPDVMNGKVEDITGLDVSSNYKLTPVNGELTVYLEEQIPLRIVAPDATKVYDGEALTNQEYTYEVGIQGARNITAMPANDVITDVTFDTTSTQTQFGEAENTIVSAKIMNGTDDVTDLYDISYVKGTLTVEKRPITLTAGSSQREENGNVLTNNTYTITAGSLATASKDSISSVTITGSILTRGSVVNVISNAAIINEATENVTDSYQISYVNGTLTLVAPDNNDDDDDDDNNDNNNGGGTTTISDGTVPLAGTIIDDGQVPLADGVTLLDEEVPLADGLGGENGTNPQTGDQNNILIWLLGLAVSIGTISIYSYKRKKDKQ